MDKLNQGPACPSCFGDLKLPPRTICKTTERHRDQADAPTAPLDLSLAAEELADVPAAPSPLICQSCLAPLENPPGDVCGFPMSHTVPESELQRRRAELAAEFGRAPDEVTATPLAATPKQRAGINRAMVRRADAARILAHLNAADYAASCQGLVARSSYDALADAAVLLVESLEGALERRDKKEEEAEAEADAGK